MIKQDLKKNNQNQKKGVKNHSDFSLPKDWQEVTLGEVCEIYSGKTRPKEKGEFPVYGGNGILNYGDKYNQENETIIIGRVGAYCGSIYFENRKFWLSDNALGVKNNEKSDINFLYYLLIDKNLNRSAIGGAQPLLTQGIINGLEINLPPPLTQKAIAGVLSAFDDKIELLQEQNQTLETLGQEIFKEWFGKYKVGDDLPDEWKVGVLGEEFEIQIGRTPPRKESQWFSKKSTGKKWISIKDIGNAGIYIFNTSEFLTDEAIEKFNIPIIAENITILSFKMTVGKLTITTEKMLSNEAIAQMKYLAGNLSSEFIYLYLKNLDFNSLGSTSSIVTAINSRIIKDLKIVVPEKEILEKFDKKIKSLFEKIKNNSEQIQTLSKTRDILLPKLMKGEVGVN